MKRELQSKDLRIGNLLYNENKEVKEVVKIGFKRVWIGKIEEYWDAVDFNDTSAIPLTIERLIAFGAKEVMPKRGVAKEFTLKTVRIEMSNSGWFSYKNSKKVIQYVHELQNLYFALRGEELELKSETKP